MGRKTCEIVRRRHAMQLLAKEREGRLLFVEEASCRKDYVCPDCLGRVRLRRGLLRKPHFYHLRRPTACRIGGKSATHLAVQRLLQELLPPGEGSIEHRFPEIGRVADLYWERQKLVFEVQCSPISLEEAVARERDYAKQDLRVVWVLHRNRFGRTRMGAAERYLKRRGCYFTNVDEKRQGYFTDSVLRQTLRVHLHKPKPLPEFPLPKPLRRRTLCFEGDAVDRYRTDPNPLWLASLSHPQPQVKQRAISLLRWYKTLFNLLLVRIAC